MTIEVFAPLSGATISLADLPDPVFAGEIIGTGIAIHPTDYEISEASPPPKISVVAPLAGRIMNMHPHAFVIRGEDDLDLLVHIGIDTVGLKGAGFTLHASQGDLLAAGETVIDWDCTVAYQAGLDIAVPIIVLDHSAKVEAAVLPNTPVKTGDLLLTISR